MSPEAIEGLVHDYGYWVILVGTYFDHYGIPLFLVFGGIAASQGLLNINTVFACGLAGGWIADLFLYFLGYKTGLQYWMRFGWVQKLSKPIQWTNRLLKSRPAVLVILGRFLFTVAKFIPPFAGMVGYNPRNYILFSFMGNILFSLAYTIASFYLGSWLLTSLKELKIVSVLTTLAIVFILFLIGPRWMKKSPGN